MVNERPGAAARTRRTLLGASTAGAAAGVMVLLAACGTKTPKPAVRTVAPGLDDADIAILNQLLDHEYKAIAGYTAGIPLLDGSAHDAAKQFLEQELYHASKLYSMIKHAGGMPDKAKTNYALGQPRSREDVLRLLHVLERAEVAAYLTAIPVMSQGSARAVLSAILANDAQHVVVLRSELELEPLVGAFVAGVE